MRVVMLPVAVFISKRFELSSWHHYTAILSTIRASISGSTKVRRMNWVNFLLRMSKSQVIKSFPVVK